MKLDLEKLGRVVELNRGLPSVEIEPEELAQLVLRARVGELRRQQLLMWHPEADVCLNCNVHRTLHFPHSKARLADRDCPCLVFEPYGVLDPEC